MKRAALALALACVLAARTAGADPIALRGVDTGRAVTVALGLPDSSAGVWLTPRLGIALEGRAFSALGASAGTRFTLLGRARGFGLEVFGAAGFEALRYQAGFALTATAAVQGRFRSEGLWLALGLASPSALELASRLDARLPLALEFAFAVRVVRVWLGAQGNASLVFAPGLSPALGVQAALTVNVPF